MENRQLLTEASIKEWFAKFNLSDTQKEEYLNLMKAIPYAQKYLGRILAWVIGNNELKEDVIFYLGEFEKNVSQITNKDLYSREYDSFENLKTVINSLPKWYDKVDIPKEVKKGLERFKDEAFIVHETDAYYGIYLGSYAASYYFCYNPRRYNDYLRATEKGKRINPGWCIGQPRTRNYYDSQAGDDGLFFLVIYKKGLEKSNVYTVHPTYFSRWDVMNLQGHSNETEPGFVAKCRSDERVKKIFKLKEKLRGFPTDIITMSVMSGIEVKPDLKSMLNLLEAKYKVEIEEDIKNEIGTLIGNRSMSVGEIVQRIIANPRKELCYLWLSGDNENFGFYEMLYKTKNLTAREKTDIARSVGNYYQVKSYLKLNYTSYGLNIDDYISEPSKLNYAVVAKFSKSIITNLVEIDKKGMSELYDVVSKFWLKFNESKDFYFFQRYTTICYYRFLTTNLMTQLLNAYLDNYNVLDKLGGDNFRNALLEKLTPSDDNEKMILYLNKRKLFQDKTLDLKAISSMNKEKIEEVFEKIDADNRLKELSSETQNRIVLFFTQMPEYFDRFEKYVNIASTYSGGTAWTGETEDYKKVLGILNEEETKIFSELILKVDMVALQYKLKNLLAVFSAPHQYLKDAGDITSMIAGCLSLSGYTFLRHWFGIKYNTSPKIKDAVFHFFEYHNYPVDSPELPKAFNACKKLVDIAMKLPSKQLEKIRWGIMDWRGFLSGDNISKSEEAFLIKAIAFPYVREHQEGTEEFINSYSLNFLVKAKDNLHEKTVDEEKLPKILLHFYKIMKGDEEKILKIVSEIETIDSNLMLATDEKSIKNLSLFSNIEVDISNEIAEEFSAAIKGVEADFVKPFNFYFKADRSAYSYGSSKPKLTDAAARSFVKNKDEILKLIKEIKWFDFNEANYSNSILMSFFNPQEYYELVILKAIASLDFAKIEEAIKKSLEEPISSHSPVIQAYVTSAKDLKKKVKNLMALQEFILNTMVKLTLLLGKRNNSWASKNSKRLIKFGNWLVKYGTAENIDGAKYFIYYGTIPIVAEKIKKLDSLGIVNQGYAVLFDRYVKLDDDKLKALDPYMREILLAFSDGKKDERIEIRYQLNTAFRNLLDKPTEEIIKIMQDKTLKQEMGLSTIRALLESEFEIMSEDSSYFYCLQNGYVNSWEYNGSKSMILVDPEKVFAEYNSDQIVRITAINKKKFGTNLILEITPDGAMKKKSEYYNDTLAKKLLTIFGKWKTDKSSDDYYDRLSNMEDRVYAFTKKELQEILFTHPYDLLSSITLSTYRNYYAQYIGADFKIVKEVVDYFKTTIGDGSYEGDWHWYDESEDDVQEAMLADALAICRILANEGAYLAGRKVSYLLSKFTMASVLAEKVFKPILGTNSLTWEAINKLNLSIEQKTALASFVGAQEPAADAE